MSESKRLADQLHRSIEGDAWHGPSWRELLAGIGREDAVCRPISGAHSIAETVAHSIVWQRVVRQRLQGETVQVSDAEDWPAAAPETDAAWREMVTEVLESGRSLVETVSEFPDEKLHQARPGLEDTWFGLILGQLQHNLYHAGQVAILRKARVAVTP